MGVRRISWDFISKVQEADGVESEVAISFPIQNWLNWTTIADFLLVREGEELSRETPRPSLNQEELREHWNCCALIVEVSKGISLSENTCLHK